MKTTRVILAILLATLIPAAAIYQRTRRPSRAIRSAMFSCCVYTDKPCHMAVFLNGAILMEKQVLFTHKVGPLARQVTVGFDDNAVTVFDGLDNAVARLSNKQADVVSLTANSYPAGPNGIRVTQSGSWTMRATERAPRVMTITIDTPETEAAK